MPPRRPRKPRTPRTPRRPRAPRDRTGAGGSGSPGVTGSGGEGARSGFAPALRRVTGPADTNHQGTVFGGVILSLIDQAGYIEARRHGLHRWVTVTIDRVVFTAPVFPGDVVQLSTRTLATGRSSVTVDVLVEAERYRSGEVVTVTEAQLKMVAVGADGRSIDFRAPPTSGEVPGA